MTSPARPPSSRRSSPTRGGWTQFAGLVLFAASLSGATKPLILSPIFQAQAASRVRISGHATLGNWECESTEILGTIEPGPELAALAKAVIAGANLPQLDAKRLGTPLAIITIPVASLQCNKPGMRDDALRALRHEDAPLIVFVLRAVSDAIVQEHDKAVLGRYRATVHGDLVLAGQLRAIEIVADIVQESGSRFRVDAAKELRMSDYDITPPRAAFGLVRTDDNVTVSFNLIFEPVAPAPTRVAVARTPLL